VVKIALFRSENLYLVSDVCFAYLNYKRFRLWLFLLHLWLPGAKHSKPKDQCANFIIHFKMDLFQENSRINHDGCTIACENSGNAI